MQKRFLILLLSVSIIGALPLAADDTATIEQAAGAPSRATAEPGDSTTRGDEITEGPEMVPVARAMTETLTTPKPEPMSHRDSVLRNILASIDSGTIPANDPLTGPQKSAQAPRALLSRLTGSKGIAWIRDNTLTAAMAIIALLLTLGFLGLVFRGKSKEKAQRFMTTTRLSLMNGEVQRACLYIENNYMAPELTPVSVCTAIVTGQPFLETMFERELGMDIADYITQVRMHRARQIFRWNSAADISFVAAKVGFNNTGDFEKKFKKTTGKDPETFRRELAASPESAA